MTRFLEKAVCKWGGCNPFCSQKLLTSGFWPLVDKPRKRTIRWQPRPKPIKGKWTASKSSALRSSASAQLNLPVAVHLPWARPCGAGRHRTHQSSCHATSGGCRTRRGQPGLQERKSHFFYNKKVFLRLLLSFLVLSIRIGWIAYSKFQIPTRCHGPKAQANIWDSPIIGA